MSFFEMFTMWAGNLSFNRQVILAVVLWALAILALNAIRYALGYGFLQLCAWRNGVPVSTFLDSDEDEDGCDWIAI